MAAPDSTTPAAQAVAATRPQKWQTVAVGLVAVGWVIAIVAVFLLLPRLLLAAYDGESFEWLNRKIAAHAALAEAEALPTRDRQWYADSAERYSYRLGLFATTGAALALLAIFWRSTKTVVLRYVLSPDYAFNLGILRATVFGVLLLQLTRLPIASVAAMPNELYKWPYLTRWALAPVPLEPWYVEIALPVAILATGMALFGWMSRWSTKLSVVLAYTLVGIPTLTGKVNHSHHVLIIALLLALSRCGDGFSIDGLVRRFRSRTVGRADAEPSVTYGLPLRLATIVIATVYFFPGFWKAAVGPDWVVGGAMTNVARTIWFQRETFEPLMRIDLLGPISALGALATIVFEMGFLPAVFFRWPRIAMAAIGMGFHIMVKQTMGISFFVLQAMYVAFIDFRSLLAWIGQRLGPRPVIVAYDGHAVDACRSVNLLLELDWLQRLQPVDARTLPDEDPLRKAFDATPGALVLVAGGDRASREITTGRRAYHRVARRVPALWLLAPLAWLPPFFGLGASLLRLAAPAKQDENASADRSSAPPAWSAKPILVAFLIAFAGLMWTGFTKRVFAWPVACYPTFDSVGEPYTDWPTFWAMTGDGERRELDDDSLRAHYGPGRYVEVLRRFVARSDDDAALVRVLRELTQVWAAAGELDLDAPPSSIEVIVGRYELTGPRRPPEPMQSETRLVAEWSDIQAAGSP